MRKGFVYILVSIMFIFGVSLLVHQKFMCDGGWFNLEQFLHHESLAVLCFVASISLLLGRHLRGK